MGSVKPRLQTDNHPNNAIVRAVVRRAPSEDFRSGQSAKLNHLPNPAVLRHAAHPARILVSHDFPTMPEHFRDITHQHPIPSAFLIPQDPPISLATLAVAGQKDAAD